MKIILLKSFVILLLSPGLWATPDFTDWSSERGFQRLERSEHKSDFFRIANVFQAETQDTFAGARAAAILVAALEISKPELLQELNRKFNVSAPSLRDLRTALDEQIISTRLYVMSESDTLERIRDVLIASLLKSSEMLLVNFAYADSQGEMVEVFAPLGAYEEESDSFLIMDLNPKRAPWKWIKAQSLFQFMNTISGEESRGFVIIQSPVKSEDRTQVTQE
ncbi:MAG: phytochelatin synthase family protein [Bdellovibrionota bacterium]